MLFRSGKEGNIFSKMAGEAGGGGDSAEEYVENGIKHASLKRDEHLEIFTEKNEGKGEKRRAYKLTQDRQVGDILSNPALKEGGKLARGPARDG